MTVEIIIVAAIVGTILFFTIRSLVRTWRGKPDGGCASCPGCELYGTSKSSDEKNNQ